MTERIRYQLPDRNLGPGPDAGHRGRGAGRGPVGRAAATRRAATARPSTPCASVIASVPMRGVVVIGEGEKDEAPMLYNGEEVGDGTGPAYDIAVDPVDGTTLLANGMPNAIAVMAAADRGSMYDPSAVFYMDKLVCAGGGGRRGGHRRTGRAQRAGRGQGAGRHAADVTVCVLNRPRHEQLIDEIRATGARIKLISDGDVAAAIAAATAASASTCCSASAARRRASSPPAR